MATIHLKQTMTVTPDQFVAGLTDFGPGRSELFGRSNALTAENRAVEVDGETFVLPSKAMTPISCSVPVHTGRFPSACQRTGF